MSDGSDVVEAMVEERMKISEEGIKERKVPKSGAVMRRVLRAALDAAGVERVSGRISADVYALGRLLAAANPEETSDDGR